jgi:glycosyltransferase involved in cell wall biosynthesis
VRALIDYRPALRERSGIGEYTHELVRALAASGAPSALDLAVFSSSWKDRLEIREAGLERLRRIDRRWPVSLLNFAWHRAGWPPVETLTGERFDVVHSMTPLLIPSRDAAQVVTIADLSFLADRAWTRAEIRRDYPDLVHAHAQRADAVVVMSEYVGAEVRRVLGVDAAKMAVIPAGAPPWTPRATTPAGSAPGYVLFVGTLEPRKNIGVLLDAFENIVAGRGGWAGGAGPELVMAGKATDAARPWLERIARPPLAGKVRHLGYVDTAHRRALYEGASVLVLPSLDEGFGLPVLEAMTLGVPVVASRRGSLPEVLGDAGQLVEAADAQGFADAIDRVLRDREFAASCVSKGIERSRQYRWDRAARQTSDLYERAVAHRRCASA